MLIAGCKKGAHHRARKEFPSSLPDRRAQYKRENSYTLHTSMLVQYNAEIAWGTEILTFWRGMQSAWRVQQSAWKVQLQ